MKFTLKLCFTGSTLDLIFALRPFLTLKIFCCLEDFPGLSVFLLNSAQIVLYLAHSFLLVFYPSIGN